MKIEKCETYSPNINIINEIKKYKGIAFLTIELLDKYGEGVESIIHDLTGDVKSFTIVDFDKLISEFESVVDGIINSDGDFLRTDYSIDVNMTTRTVPEWEDCLIIYKVDKNERD